MKKLILSSVFVLGAMVMTSSLFAQGSLQAMARRAATDAGCLADYNGSIDFYVTNIGKCSVDCGEGCIGDGLLQEVLLVPNPNNHIAPFVKLAPLARVTICGGETVVSAECY